MYQNRTYRRFLDKTAVLASAILCLAACVKTEVVIEAEKVPVTFSTYSQKTLATKADTSFVAPGGNFAVGAEIGVFGFYHDGATWAGETSAGTNIPDFMYHQKVVKQSDGSWTYSPIKYWPNESGASAASTDIDRLSFWGYYPYGATGLTLYKPGTTTAYDNNTLGLPKLTFTQQQDPSEMVDLMIATPLKDLYKNDSDGHGAVTGGEVNLVFKHALSLIVIELAEGTGAELNSFSVTNLYSSGVLEDPSTLAWTGVSNSFSVSETSTVVEGADIVSMLLIPQEIDASTTLSINYDIHFASSDPDHPAPIVYSGNSGSALLRGIGGITEWEAGKRYVYRVSAGFERIEFESAVASDWSTGVDNIPVN